MKKVLAVIAGILALVAGTSASAGVIINFTDGYAPATWTVSFLGTVVGGTTGSVVETSTTLTLNGGDGTVGCVGGVYAFVGPCEIDVTTSNIQNPFVFDWHYVTADDDGPAGDIFGYLVNSVHHQLSDPGGAVNQSGHVVVSAVNSFGWFVNCTDCTAGSATAVISNFQAGTAAAAAPEPATLALLGLGLAGIVASRRRKLQ